MSPEEDLKIAVTGACGHLRSGRKSVETEIKFMEGQDELAGTGGTV